MKPIEYALITMLQDDDLTSAILTAKFAIKNGERTMIVDAVANANITARPRDLIDVIDEILLDMEG